MTIRERIIEAGWTQGCQLRQRDQRPNPRYPESENDTTILIAAACEALRLVREEVDDGLEAGVSQAYAKGYCDANNLLREAINELLAELSDGTK